jgi:methyl-accepting chemotaxis protein
VEWGTGMRVFGSTLKQVARFNPLKLFSRFGIKVKLQAAFAAAALMTVVASAVAIVSYQSVETDVERVARHEVPLMTDALRLSVVSGEISTAAARFVGARTVAEQKELTTQISQRTESLRRAIDRLKAKADPSYFAGVEAAAGDLDKNLAELDKTIVQKTNMRVALEQQLDAIHKIHTQIGDKLTPIVDDSYFDVVMSAESVGKSGDKLIRGLVSDNLVRMQAMVQLGSETNLVTGLLTAGALTSSPAILAMIEDRFTASVRRAQRELARLPDDQKYTALRQRTEQLVKLSNFKGPRAADELARLQNVFRAHERLAEILITMIDDLHFTTVLESEQAAKRTSQVVKELASNQISGLRNAMEIAVQTHLIASLMSEVAVASEPASLVPLQDRFRASSALITKSLGALKNDAIQKDVETLLAFGAGNESIFELRKKELLASVAADKTVQSNLRIQRDLENSVGLLVSNSESAMIVGTTNLLDDIERNRTLLIIVAVASLLAAGMIAYFYVQRSLIRRLTTLGSTMERLSLGDNQVDIAAAEDRDEVGKMARAVLVFRNAAIEKIRVEAEADAQRRDAEAERKRNEALQVRHAEEQAQAIQSLAEGLRKLSDGELAFRLTDGFTDEYARIKEDFNATMERLQETMGAIVGSVREVSNAAAEISASTTDLSQRTEEQAASLEETSASMEEIAATVKKNAENARIASQFANDTRKVADRGGEVAGSAVSSMARIEESSKKISDIIGVIDEIAFQTNLLALNAAVEAARAGEAGRGFAVVAAEVRSLAQRSSQAAKDIKDLINKSSDQVGEGVELVNQAGTALTEIVASIKKVTDIVGEIASASAEQSTGIDQISTALSQMDEITQQNSALVEENAASVKTLEQQSQSMGEQVSIFKLGSLAEMAQEMRRAAPEMTETPRRPAKRSARRMGGNGTTQGVLAVAQDDPDWQEF